jgi:hypothetical protein
MRYLRHILTAVAVLTVALILQAVGVPGAAIVAVVALALLLVFVYFGR